MRRVHPLLVSLLLFLPASASAAPVAIDVLSGSVPGFGFSWLHAPAGCASDGFWMCGNPSHVISGSLTADLVGDSTFEHIKGIFTINGTNYAVSGRLDFTVAPDALLGTVTVGSLGTFDFYNMHFSGPANGHEGSTLSLWGQNFDPTELGQAAPANGWGIDLGAGVRPIPEPGSAALLALGGLVVGGAVRRQQP